MRQCALRPFDGAVDHEGVVIESFVTKRRDTKAVLKFLRKSLRLHGPTETIASDRLASYGAALKELGGIDKREVGRWQNNRIENSHQPFLRRERAMLRFRRMRSLACCRFYGRAVKLIRPSARTQPG
jgi:putative transposase